MTLVHVELRRIALELRHTHVAAHGREQQREVVLVRAVHADGSEGWGECSALARPTYTAEHLDGAWRLLRDELVPAALAGRPSDVVGHPMAAAALADARLDARLQGTGTNLAAHLGATATTVATTTVIGIETSIDALLARVAGVAGGVKLKIAPGWAGEPLRAVRAAWPARWLAADANGSLDAADHDELAVLDSLGLAYLEQPVTGLAASADVAARLSVAVALDEDLDSLDTAIAAFRLGGLGVANVKPARLGGVARAADLLRWAAAEGVPAFVGGMLETGVGRAGALAVAALPGAGLPTDLGPSGRYWTDDVTEPFELDADLRLTVPAGPGIGRRPRASRLASATVAVESFDR